MNARRRRSGQVLAWYGILLALVLLPVVGLAIDTGLLFTAHRKLQMVADGAARVGAMQVDMNAVYNTDRVALDPAEAEQAAESYLASTPGITGIVTATPDGIQVQARRTLVLPFQSAFHRPPVEIAAVAVAVPCPGINQAEGAC